MKIRATHRFCESWLVNGRQKFSDEIALNLFYKLIQNESLMIVKKKHPFLMGNNINITDTGINIL